MATIPQFDPLTTEATSPFLAGLSEGLSRIASVLNLTTTTITDSAMSEVYIGESDRYRIYQVAAGNRLWLSDPAPVVKKNGSVITTSGANFTIDYIGGSIKFEAIARLTSGDTVTVSATRIASASTEIEDIKTDMTAVEAITANFLGYYSSVSALSTAHATGSDGNFAIIGGTVDSIYMWDSTGSAWKDIYKTVDLSTYYTKTEADALLSAKEASITAHGSTTASDLYYYGGRKTWQELTARVRASVLTGIDTATSAVITATDTVLGGLGKLQAQITGKPFISGTGDPTTSTAGTIGRRYVNTSTGAAFRCATIVGEVYTWVKQGATDDLVDGNVINSKLANMANNTVKGNVSGSASAPSDLTSSQARGAILEDTSAIDSVAYNDLVIVSDVSASAGSKTKNTTVSNFVNQSQNHVWLYDGRDLSTIFTAAQFIAAVRADDWSNIRIGDYWPITLTGTIRDYGSYTCPDSTNYYSDTALSILVGQTSTAYEAAYVNSTYCSISISSTTYYVSTAACAGYYERSLSSATFKMEIAAISPYIGFGTPALGAHVLFVSRDCAPFNARMRKTTTDWTDPAATNPWVGSALYKTLNDPTYGIRPLVSATGIGAYIHMGTAATGLVMALETKAAGASLATSIESVGRGIITIPTESEVRISRFGESLGAINQPQLPIFSGTIRHIRKGVGDGGSLASWWTCSSSSGSATSFCRMSGPNGITAYSSSSASYFPICFIVA